MTTPVTVSIPHQLGRAEARRRIESGFGRVVEQLPVAGAVEQAWDADRLTFRVSALGQTISGVIDVLDASVDMEIVLPGLLGLIANRVGGRLRQAGQLLLTKD